MTSPLTLIVAPNGSWRRNRFEFCNALEAVVSTSDARAIEELRKMGVEVRKDPELLALQREDDRIER